MRQIVLSEGIKDARVLAAGHTNSNNIDMALQYKA